jgi:mannose-6-phosphate isomerase-like protein (cupin superfamily)
MEQVKIAGISEFQARGALKKVPFMTGELMAALLFIDSGSPRLAQKDPVSDRIYYIVSGTGKLTLEDSEVPITEGSLVLVPRLQKHYFSTNDEKMTILNVRSIKGSGR